VFTRKSKSKAPKAAKPVAPPVVKTAKTKTQNVSASLPKALADYLSSQRQG